MPSTAVAVTSREFCTSRKRRGSGSELRIWDFKVEVRIVAIGPRPTDAKPYPNSIIAALSEMQKPSPRLSRTTAPVGRPLTCPSTVCINGFGAVRSCVNVRPVCELVYVATDKLLLTVGDIGAPSIDISG